MASLPKKDAMVLTQEVNRTSRTSVRTSI